MPRELPALFTVDELAGRLHKSRRWLQAFLRGRNIGLLAGRTRLFTESDVFRLIQELPACPSSSSRPGKAKARIGRSAARTSGSMWTRAAALTNDQSLDPASNNYKPPSKMENIPRSLRLHSGERHPS